MATTLNEQQKYNGTELNLHHFKVTAGGADTSVTINMAAGTKILGLSGPVKTTGAAGAMNATYVESTGVLTITCGNSDVIEVGVWTK